jgi:hypothetical protein
LHDHKINSVPLVNHQLLGNLPFSSRVRAEIKVNGGVGTVRIVGRMRTLSPTVTRPVGRPRIIEMDRIFVRTCSADQAAVLSAAAGRFARVHSSRVRICPPDGGSSIDPDSNQRYLARIELVEDDTRLNGAAPDQVSKIVSDLFGPYLE